MAIAGSATARPASSGWYAEGGLGAVKTLPHDGDRISALGPSLDLRLGRDLVSWFSIGIDLSASSHEAKVPAPPVGEWFQLYRMGADARIGGRIDHVALFLEGGVGAAIISSNVLGKVMVTEPDEYVSIAFTAGAGLEYQLENRHYAFGLGADGFVMPQFDNVKAVATRLYLRYTY